MGERRGTPFEIHEDTTQEKAGVASSDERIHG